jgi:hypothetical protein
VTLTCLGGLAACGKSGHDGRSHSAASSLAPATAGRPATAKHVSPKENELDAEEDRAGQDSDDQAILHFGQRAAPDEARFVVALVRRYYAAAAAHDGSKACALLYSQLAEAVPKDYGKFPGPPALRGATCAVVMSKIFKQQPRRLTSTPHVLQVRARGNQGLVLLRAGRRSERHLLIHREHGVWKVWALFDLGTP